MPTGETMLEKMRQLICGAKMTAYYAEHVFSNFWEFWWIVGNVDNCVIFNFRPTHFYDNTYGSGEIWWKPIIFTFDLEYNLLLHFDLDYNFWQK